MVMANKRLAQDTKAFWVISKTFNGRYNAPQTVESALKRLNIIDDRVLPPHPLCVRAAAPSSENNFVAFASHANQTSTSFNLGSNDEKPSSTAGRRKIKAKRL